MGDQRRRGGRGRSGKGGRIPRRGDQQATQIAGESFTGFPLDVTGPIRVTTAVDAEAVGRTLAETLERERRQAAALEPLARQDGELGELRGQVERHRDMLEQLARDLGAELPAAGEAAEGETAPALAEVVAGQRLAHLGWMALQRAAYASGDRRIDRVVRPVIREKDRHAEVLEAHALRQATMSMFRELDE
jgi:hypothetical protein